MASRKYSGFTLLEVMVSLFLLTLVIASVYSSWNAVVKGSRVGLQAAAEVQRSRIALRTIEDALSSARMFTADAQAYAFEGQGGNKAYLSFVASVPYSFPRGSKFGDFTVRRVSFGLEAAPDSERQLVLRQTPPLMEMDIDEENHPVILAKSVHALEFAFWDRRNGEWLEEWTQTNQLPAMVRITLEFSKNGKRSEPLTRIVSLPSIAVPPNWQRPGPQQQPIQ
ncbi:MAG TPA: prepilin-type N-terminal cleavage/methylation domain-containing protein [Verrucomicrobiae bacterium]|nr:prepilin-type N-terminal cleavage/methylation domain-containing protein [Verrucomicrobiae bacterium]